MKPRGISSRIRWCERMQIKDIDFQKCDNLVSWIDFINSAPSECDSSEFDWKHSRVYIYGGDDTATIYGMIFLRKKHGKYDGLIIKQELRTFLDRMCIDVQFTEIDDNKISLTANERHNIIVDSNKTLVPFFCGEPSTEPQAKRIKEVSHYTEANNAIKILQDNIFIGKSLSRYKSEMSFVSSENSRRLYFISCFSTNLESDDSMWERFADKHSGCKIDLVFKRTFADAFPLNYPVKCTDEQGNQHEISSGFNHADGTLPHVFFTTHYSMAQYTDDLSNKATLQVYNSGNVDDFTISPYVGRNVSKSFEYQKEVRILLQLNSFYREEIPFIQKIEIPFSIDQVDRIVLTIGKNATDSMRRRIKEELGDSHIITIQNEGDTLCHI